MPKIKHRELGNYLTPKDVDDGAVVRITGAGQYTDTKYRKDRLELPVVPHRPDKWLTGGGKEKVWGTNKTTEVHLFEGFKVETTDEWVNRLVSIEKAKQMISGEWQQVLYGEPVEGEAPPPAAPSAAPPRAAVPPEAAPEPKEPALSEVSVLWLRYNETLVGAEVPALDYNAMPKTARDELWNAGLLYAKDDLFFLKPEAKRALE